MNVEYNNKGRMLLLNGRMEEARFSSDVHLAHHPSSSVVSDVLTVFYSQSGLFPVQTSLPPISQ